MRIIAKYHGRCKICGGRIKPGDEIEWSKGKGSAHIGCYERRHLYTLIKILLSFLGIGITYLLLSR